MLTRLAAQSEAIVRGVWAARLGVSPGSLGERGTVFVDRPDLSAAVVVRLGESTVVAAPGSAVADLRGVDIERMLDVDVLLDALVAHHPALIGIASLSFGDRETVSVPGDREMRPASDAEVAAVLSTCSEEDRDESGLAAMGARWVVPGLTGHPVALAGYEIWDGALAHLGVLVSPESRRRGAGLFVAARAAGDAVNRSLVAQWRCRIGNVPSERLGGRLGFVRLGTQVSIDLGRHAPTDGPEG